MATSLLCLVGLVIVVALVGMTAAAARKGSGVKYDNPGVVRGYRSSRRELPRMMTNSWGATYQSYIRDDGSRGWKKVKFPDPGFSREKLSPQMVRELEDFIASAKSEHGKAVPEWAVSLAFFAPLCAWVLWITMAAVDGLFGEPMGFADNAMLFHLMFVVPMWYYGIMVALGVVALICMGIAAIVRRVRSWVAWRRLPHVIRECYRLGGRVVDKWDERGSLDADHDSEDGKASVGFLVCLFLAIMVVWAAITALGYGALCSALLEKVLGGLAIRSL